MVTIAIWGDYARKFDLSPDEHPVVAIKRTSVTEYNGRTLNSNSDSLFLFDPAHSRTQEITDWYQKLKDVGNLINISTINAMDHISELPNLSMISDLALACQNGTALTSGPIYISVYTSMIK